MPRKAIAGVGVFLLVYLSWLAFRWIPASTSTVGDLSFLPIGAAAVFASWRASRRCLKVPRLRWFWRLLALALACQWLGDATTAVYGLAGAEIPFPSLADPAYLAFYPLMLLALLRVPVAPTLPSQRLRLGLDLATVTAAGAMVIWYLILKDTIVGGGQSATQMITSVAYPLGDLVLLGGLGVMLLRWSPAIMRRPLVLIAAGLAMFIAADLAYGYAILNDGYSSGGPIDSLWVVALAFFVLAAASQVPARPDAPETAVPTREISEQRVGWLPFAALAVGSAVLISAQWRQDFIAETSLLLGGIALAGLIAVRQYMTQREMIRLQRELREAQSELALLASRDPLTNVANRRAIGEALSREIDRARRHRRALSILFMDIDHFKAINDCEGHPFGDRVLQEFAVAVNDCLRPEDRLGRWGGEEFLVVLPETDRQQAAWVGERVRSQVEAHGFQLLSGEAVSCSVGTAVYPDDGADAAALIESADRAMYEAKQSGRNQVVSASDANPRRALSPLR